MALSSNGPDSKAQSVLHFAKWLQHALDQHVDHFPTLATHLDALAANPLEDTTTEERLDLNGAGIELWNKCRGDDLGESIQDKHKVLLAQGQSSQSALVLVHVLTCSSQIVRVLHTLETS